jgi:hypothetical protein
VIPYEFSYSNLVWRLILHKFMWYSRNVCENHKFFVWKWSLLIKPHKPYKLNRTNTVCNSTDGRIKSGLFWLINGNFISWWFKKDLVHFPVLSFSRGPSGKSDSGKLDSGKRVIGKTFRRRNVLGGNGPLGNGPQENEIRVIGPKEN